MVNGLSLDSIGDSEYFSVTAPAIAGATLLVNAVANGHSLMSPKVTVIDAATGRPSPSTPTPTSTAIPPRSDPERSGWAPLPDRRHRRDAGRLLGRQLLAAGRLLGRNATTPTTPTTPCPVTTPTRPDHDHDPDRPRHDRSAHHAVPQRPSPTATTVATTTVDPYCSEHLVRHGRRTRVRLGQSLIRNVTLRSGRIVRVFAFEPASAGLVFVASANAS